MVVSYRCPPPPPHSPAAAELTSSHELCVTFEYCTAHRPTESLKGSSERYLLKYGALAPLVVEALKAAAAARGVHDFSVSLVTNDWLCVANSWCEPPQPQQKTPTSSPACNRDGGTAQRPSSARTTGDARQDGAASSNASPENTPQSALAARMAARQARPVRPAPRRLANGSGSGSAPFPFEPRLGAFEVRVWLHNRATGARLGPALVFSKLESGCWPNSHAIERQAVHALDGALRQEARRRMWHATGGDNAAAAPAWTPGRPPPPSMAGAPTPVGAAPPRTPRPYVVAPPPTARACGRPSDLRPPRRGAGAAGAPASSSIRTSLVVSPHPAVSPPRASTERAELEAFFQQLVLDAGSDVRCWATVPGEGEGECESEGEGEGEGEGGQWWAVARREATRLLMRLAAAEAAAADAGRSAEAAMESALELRDNLRDVEAYAAAAYEKLRVHLGDDAPPPPQPRPRPRVATRPAVAALEAPPPVETGGGSSQSSPQARPVPPAHAQQTPQRGRAEGGGDDTPTPRRTGAALSRLTKRATALFGLGSAPPVGPASASVAATAASSSSSPSSASSPAAAAAAAAAAASTGQTNSQRSSPESARGSPCGAANTSWMDRMDTVAPSPVTSAAVARPSHASLRFRSIAKSVGALAARANVLMRQADEVAEEIIVVAAPAAAATSPATTTAPAAATVRPPPPLLTADDDDLRWRSRPGEPNTNPTRRKAMLRAATAPAWATADEAAENAGSGWFRGVALFGFDALDDGESSGKELSVVEGEALFVRTDEPAPEGWRFVARVDGSASGLVPSDYVHVYDILLVAPCAFAATPAEEAVGLLSFAQGERLVIRVGVLSPGWWLARSADATGDPADAKGGTGGRRGCVMRHLLDGWWRGAAMLIVANVWAMYTYHRHRALRGAPSTTPGRTIAVRAGAAMHKSAASDRHRLKGTAVANSKGERRHRPWPLK